MRIMAVLLTVSLWLWMAGCGDYEPAPLGKLGDKP